ncbi:MAG: hypothetical protein C0599_02040 [Salinivirgaceae bacterium]|nr:MAG: hypothetical protein C0599_02040 [Salinivirgaceae bacterium]
MLKKLFTLLAIVGLIGTMNQTIAQDENSEENSGIFDASIGADIMSRYVWRGTQFSTAPVIQPAFEVSAFGVSLGAWGSYSFLGALDGAEADIYLSYSFMDDMLSVTVTDYFFPDDNTDRNKYFNYDKDETGHILEGTLAFNGTESLPLSLMVATNFYGADAKKINDDENSADFNQEDGIQYSTYVEAAYNFKVSGIDMNAFIGAVINKPKEADEDTFYTGESGFYGQTRGVCNLGITGSKELKITESYALPIQASFITNPMSGDVFMVFGISF